jgi:hypothetical protein
MRRPLGVSITGPALERLRALSDRFSIPYSRFAEAYMLAALGEPPALPEAWPTDSRFNTNFSVDVAIVPVWQDFASQYHNGRRFLLSWLVMDAVYHRKALELIQQHYPSGWDRLISRVCKGGVTILVPLSSGDMVELEALAGQESPADWVKRAVSHAIYADRRQADGAKSVLLRLSTSEQAQLHALRRADETDAEILRRLLRDAR